jgi:alpha-ketoglutarate-dependent taurine dioxygenase
MRVEARLEPFGVVVRGLDPRDALDAKATEEIRRLLDEHHLVLIRGLDRCLTPDEQVAFMAAFGEVERPAMPASGSPFLFRAVNSPRLGLALNAGTEGFHNDGLEFGAPTALVSYHIIEVARTGGDTLFANAHAAHDALSDDVRARLDDAIAIYGFRLPIGDIGTSSFRLVRRHPRTGKRALALALAPTPGTLVILGMSEAERTDLFAYLDELVRRPDILYRHRWQPRDLILSDNAALVHCGELSDPSSPRVLHRVSVAGEVDLRVQHRFTVLPAATLREWTAMLARAAVRGLRAWLGT